jgi:hypothetical protein
MQRHGYARIAFLSILFTVLAAASFGQEDAQSDDDEGETTEDTCGKWGKEWVILSASTHTDRGPRGRNRYDNKYSLNVRWTSKGEHGLDTNVTSLLSWEEEENVWLEDNELMVNRCKTGKKTVALYYDSTLLAEFEDKRDSLVVAPAFRRKILAGMEKGDPSIWYGPTRNILSGTGVNDSNLLAVLQVYALKDSVRNGYVDNSIDAIGEFLGTASDPTVKRSCKRLLDSLVAWKKSVQPVSLADAKKAGRILNPPVYPPLDSPTVFWKGSLLCVVQEDDAKPKMMRTFETASGKWGAKTRVEYPESGMYKMYEKNTGTYSMGCEYEHFCWSKNLGAISDDPCDGLQCGPLLILDDTAVGSVESREDLLKAGGSCAAGNGQLEFVDEGKVRNMGDTKMSWNLFDKPLESGTRQYSFELQRQYPVVVSPDQNWIAYARSGKDGKGVELWVARLKYKP